MQARLERLHAANATGSVISNIVVKLGDIPAVQVKAENGRLNLYIDGAHYRLAAGDSPLILSDSGILSSNLTEVINGVGDPSLLASMSEVMMIRVDETNHLVISTGDGASVVTSLQTNFLALIVALPESFQNSTSGLLGTFNGNPNDDFRTRSGTVLNLSSEREIYEQFGLQCKFSHLPTRVSTIISHC